MKNATLCLPLKENKIMLGMKKRGFGIGKLNGFGGKIEPGESVEQAAIRELKEEIGIFASSLKKVAELDFNFPFKPEFDQKVHVFIVSEWKNLPKESEEMSFQWFDLNKIPFEKMWDDDKYWLPLVLQGKNLKAEFHFAEDNNTIAKKTIKEI